jgi:hypothetical protein
VFIALSGGVSFATIEAGKQSYSDEEIASSVTNASSQHLHLRASAGVTEYDYGKYRSLVSDWWDYIDPDRWGSVSGFEIGNSVWEIAWRYPL